MKITYSTALKLIGKDLDNAGLSQYGKQVQTAAGLFKTCDDLDVEATTDQKIAVCNLLKRIHQQHAVLGYPIFDDIFELIQDIEQDVKQAA